MDTNSPTENENNEGSSHIEQPREYSNMEEIFVRPIHLVINFHSKDLILGASSFAQQLRIWENLQGCCTATT